MKFITQDYFQNYKNITTKLQFLQKKFFIAVIKIAKFVSLGLEMFNYRVIGRVIRVC
jgi:hypothetical protein